jgi:hypothetical protein
VTYRRQTREDLIQELQTIGMLPDEIERFLQERDEDHAMAAGRDLAEAFNWHHENICEVSGTCNCAEGDDATDNLIVALTYALDAEDFVEALTFLQSEDYQANVEESLKNLDGVR